MKATQKKKRFSILSNQQGAILPMVLMAGVLMAGVMYYVIGLDEEAEKENLRFRFKQEVDQVVNHMNFILANPKNCLLTFGDASQPVNVTNRVMNPNQIVYTLDESVDPAVAATFTYLTDSNGVGANGYYDSKVKIRSYTLEADPDNVDDDKYKREFILVEVVNKRLLAKEASAETIWKRIPIYVEWGPVRDLTTDEPITPTAKEDKRIVSCRAVSNTDDQLWKLGVGASTYYGGDSDTYRVGVGREPETANTSDEEKDRFNSELIIGEGTDGKAIITGDTTSTNFTYVSDENLKANIRPIEDALEKIQALRGVGFNWVSDERKDFGFIAQEVEDELPELVRTNQKTGLKKVDYGKIIPFLVNVFQEQQKKIQQLKSRIQKIEK